MSQTLPRSLVLDLLPTMSSIRMEICIKPIKEEAFSFTVFSRPLSMNLWIVLICLARIISCFLTGIEGYFCLNGHQESCYRGYLKNLWTAFKANFGGKPTLIHTNVATYRIVVFLCLLTGVVVWIAYRAEFTSVLSIKKLNLPFNSLEGLLESDYK